MILPRNPAATINMIKLTHYSPFEGWGVDDAEVHT